MKILGTTSVELVLVEVFGIPLTWLDAIGSLQGTWAVEGGNGPFDSYPLTRKQFSRTVRVHKRQVTRRRPGVCVHTRER